MRLRRFCHRGNQEEGFHWSLPRIIDVNTTDLIHSFIISRLFSSIVSMKTPLPSNKKFGLLFAGVFFALALYVYLRSDISVVAISCGLVSLLFFAASFLAPNSLRSLNKAWFLLGKAMGSVVSPIVLGIIFFGLLTPLALISRLFVRYELRLLRPKSETYLF